MPTFAYRALTSAGEQVNGRIEAADSRTAIQRLQAGGLIPIKAEPVAERSEGGGLAGLSGPGGAARPLTEATRELATLLGAGLTIEASLAMLGEAVESRRLKASLALLLARVRGGRSLSQAMAEAPTVFPRVYVGMVRAGESAGRLGEALAELAVLRERSQKLQEKVVSSLIYPSVLALTSLGSIIVLMTVVVPRFEPLFAQAGEDLPESAAVLLAIEQGLRAYGDLLLVGLLGLVLAALLALRRPRLREALDRMLLGAPLLGLLSRERATAQTARGLATMLAGGLELPSALTMTTEMLSNRSARAALGNVVSGVRQGRRMGDCLEEAGFLTPMGLQMLRVGEESGRLAAVASHLADTAEERVGSRLTRLVSLIEPATVIGMGVLVGAIVTTILTAVLSVNKLAL